MPTNVDMYRNIEAERARKGLTIKELADMLGLKEEKTYRNWKNNSKDLSSSTLIKMSEIFGCSVDYLLGLSTVIK